MAAWSASAQRGEQTKSRAPARTSVGAVIAPRRARKSKGGASSMASAGARVTVTASANGARRARRAGRSSRGNRTARSGAYLDVAPASFVGRRAAPSPPRTRARAKMTSCARRRRRPSRRRSSASCRRGRGPARAPGGRVRTPGRRSRRASVRAGWLARFEVRADGVDPFRVCLERTRSRSRADPSSRPHRLDVHDGRHLLDLGTQVTPVATGGRRGGKAEITGPAPIRW